MWYQSKKNWKRSFCHFYNKLYKTSDETPMQIVLKIETESDWINPKEVHKDHE
jgi:hypothetical protein